MTELYPNQSADDVDSGASQAGPGIAPTGDAAVSDPARGAQWSIADERDTTTRDEMYVMHRGVVITVSAHRNAEGAWLADISARVDGKPLDLPHIEPVTPEWLTESEALRAGIEHGCYLVDRYAPDVSSQQEANPRSGL